MSAHCTAHHKGIRARGLPSRRRERNFGKVTDQFLYSEKEWRAQGQSWNPQQREFDDVVDFDAVCGTGKARRGLLPAYDRGDHLHANDRRVNVSAKGIHLAYWT